MKKKFENLRKLDYKAKGKIKSSKKSGISTKESQDIAGDQSSITFMRCLDPFIASRISKKNFSEGTDDPRDQADELLEDNFDESDDDKATTSPIEKLLPSPVKNASLSEKEKCF